MAVNGKVIPRELKPDANAQRAQPRRQRMPSKRDAANAKGKSAPGDAAVPVIATALDTPPPPQRPQRRALGLFRELGHLVEAVEQQPERRGRRRRRRRRRRYRCHQLKPKLVLRPLVRPPRPRSPPPQVRRRLCAPLPRTRCPYKMKYQWQARCLRRRRVLHLHPAKNGSRAGSHHHAFASFPEHSKAPPRAGDIVVVST